MDCLIVLGLFVILTYIFQVTRCNDLSTRCVVTDPCVIRALQNAINNTSEGLELEISQRKTMEERMDSLLIKIDGMQEKIDSMQQKMNGMQEKLDAEKMEKDALKLQLDAQQDTHKKYRVAFTACLSQVHSYNPGNKIIFDMVYNYGESSYNSSTGHFSCPYSGIYLFQLNILSEKWHKFSARFMKNNFDKTFHYGFGEALVTDTREFHQASNGMFITCNKGDTIWVVAADNADQIHGTTLHGVQRCLSSFSGHLVAALE